MNATPQQYLGYWIRRFLDEYLLSVRNMSLNTRRSYRDTFRLLVMHVAAVKHTDVDRLAVSDISAPTVLDFLSQIETTRSCSTRTRNQRLSAITTFAKFVSACSPEHIEWCREIRSIPTKKGPKRMITYLEKDEMDGLINTPRKNTPQGLRDHVLLLFLYNTGARADEAASLTVEDVSLPRSSSETPFVTIMGKGRKSRRCPLWRTTAKLLEDTVRGRSSDEPLFLNCRGRAITRFGIYEMVERHAKALAKTLPSISKKRPSPHTIRHTTATHLLQAGVDINTIRAWLGHVSINTTNIYVEIDMATKTKAIEKCMPRKLAGNHRHWRSDRKLMDYLCSL